MKVRTQTNLVQRGGVYYFRKKVPTDLRQQYGQESIRKSLRQFPALADARREAANLAAFYEDEFAAKRQSLKPAKAAPLTPELVPVIAKALEAHILTADEEIRTEGLDADSFAAWGVETAATLAEVRRAYATGDASPIDSALDDWLTGLSIDADRSSPEFKLLRREFLKARLAALQKQALRHQGELVEVPEALSVVDLKALTEPLEAIPKAIQKGGPRLGAVIAYWKGTGIKSDRTIATAENMVNEFIKLHGDLPLTEITKSHFVALRDAQLATVKPSTVQTRFNLLKAAYTVCLEDDQLNIKQNPLQYVKIRNQDAGEKERDAFNSDQLQVLFDSPVFTAGDRPIGGRGETAFWGPLVALYTGARLDEILSLRTDGVYVVEGVTVFHFRHRPELGQKLKGKAKNNRRVPVHPELVRLGFLDYLANVSKRPALATGASWLFPDIDRNEKVRNHSSAWGAWFGRYLTRCGVKSDKLTFHSFRHTFKHFCRASGIAEDQHDAMTGHTSTEVARRYGSCAGYPVGILAEAIPKLVFGKLDLSRVACCR